MSQKVMLQLYCRELHKQTLLELDALNVELASSLSYKNWVNTKRALKSEEVADSVWIKSCTGGYITELHFQSDGTLTEFRLFDRFKTVGTWQEKEGLLHVTIVKGDNQYQFIIVGNADVNIHSAVEYKNGELHSYLKLAQVKS
ncbi:hypothetical protein L4C33_17170 [Vibrio makurazakiensis]|uniref:hypothetical protein n=1 Tax=Vibrio makurazakiensis TaxID=2910250 RepID=UPI003D12C54B